MAKRFVVAVAVAAVPSGYAGTATVRDGVVYASVARGGTCIIFR